MIVKLLIIKLSYIGPIACVKLLIPWGFPCCSHLVVAKPCFKRWFKIKSIYNFTEVIDVCDLLQFASLLLLCLFEEYPSSTVAATYSTFLCSLDCCSRWAFFDNIKVGESSRPTIFRCAWSPLPTEYSSCWRYLVVRKSFELRVRSDANK
jgi:hypothetical protein